MTAWDFRTFVNQRFYTGLRDTLAVKLAGQAWPLPGQDSKLTIAVSMAFYERVERPLQRMTEHMRRNLREQLKEMIT